MAAERSEHEPEEYDPEADLRDPEADGPTIPQITAPGVEAPRIEIPSVDTDEIDAPGPIQRDFWLLVLVLKIAVPLTAAGVMLLVFEYDRSYWLPSLLAGVALIALAARRYVRFRDLVERTHAEATDDTRADETPESSDPGTDDADPGSSAPSPSPSNR